MYYELLLSRNDLTTLTNIMKCLNVMDIVYICRNMKFKSHIYIHIHLKMVAGSTSSLRQNLLYSGKLTESTEPLAGCNETLPLLLTLPLPLLLGVGIA